MLAALVPERVLPFASGDSRKRGPKPKRPRWSAERRARRCFCSAVAGQGDGARRKRRQAFLMLRRSGLRWMRLSALRLPFYCAHDLFPKIATAVFGIMRGEATFPPLAGMGGKSLAWREASLGCKDASRERGGFVHDPPSPRPWAEAVARTSWTTHVMEHAGHGTRTSWNTHVLETDLLFALPNPDRADNAH